MFKNETDIDRRDPPEGYDQYSPIEIEPNVYIGTSTSTSGEKIYLRMELITPENTSAWNQYQYRVKKMADDHLGVLTYLARFTDKVIAEDGSVHYSFKDNKGQSYIPESGLNEDEFRQFIDFLGEQGFTRGSIKLKVLMANTSGSNFMNTSICSGSRYIIYASKTPDFLIQNIPIAASTLSIKSFISQYGDLLMCMGSDFSTGKSFTNRGISRNPINVIENTHKGLSMILHGFSGAVAQKFFPHMETMDVKPVGFMQYLICTTFKPEDVTIMGGQTLDEAKEETKHLVMDPANSTLEAPTNYIKVDALADCYYKACRAADVMDMEASSSKAAQDTSGKTVEVKARLQSDMVQSPASNASTHDNDGVEESSLLKKGT